MNLKNDFMGFLIGTILVVFIFSAFFLILLVMIQSGKGGGLGGLGGGSGASQTAFGSSSADIMTRATRYVAIGFVLIAFILSFLFAKKESIIAPISETPVEIKEESKTISPAKEEVKTTVVPAAKDESKTIPAPAKQ